MTKESGSSAAKPFGTTPEGFFFGGLGPNSEPPTNGYGGYPVDTGISHLAPGEARSYA